jgi:hypothetical protein
MYTFFLERARYWGFIRYILLVTTPIKLVCRTMSSFLAHGASHYVDAANTNWDLLVSFYLMAYRATPTQPHGTALSTCCRERDETPK